MSRPPPGLGHRPPRAVAWDGSDRQNGHLAGAGKGLRTNRLHYAAAYTPRPKQRANKLSSRAGQARHWHLVGIVHTHDPCLLQARTSILGLRTQPAGARANDRRSSPHQGSWQRYACSFKAGLRLRHVGGRDPQSRSPADRRPRLIACRTPGSPHKGRTSLILDRIHQPPIPALPTGPGAGSHLWTRSPLEVTCRAGCGIVQRREHKAQITFAPFAQRPVPSRTQRIRGAFYGISKL